MAIHRIAFASRDRITVGDHFGFADIYQIIDLNKNGDVWIEAREVVSPRKSGEGHGISAFARVVEALSDCEAIVVAKIGPEAARYVMRNHIRVFCASGNMQDILDNILRNIVDDSDNAAPVII